MELRFIKLCSRRCKQMVEILNNAPSPEISYFASLVVDLRLHKTMELPFGSLNSRPSGIVEIDIETPSGTYSGYGEGATLPIPLFTDDSAATVSGAGAFLLRKIRSEGPIGISQALDIIQDTEFPKGEKFPTARMMIEMALLDAYAKSMGKSMGELLGIPQTLKSIPYGKSIGVGTSKEIIEEANMSLKAGASKIKLKITPSSHQEVIKAINKLKSGGKFEIMVDANGSFDPENKAHIKILKTIDKLGLLMIEEPVSRVGRLKGIEAVKKLRQSVNLDTPICLDDCLTDLETTIHAIDQGYADVVNIKPGRIGSIIKSVELGSYCQQKKIQIMVGGMLEATPGRCMTVTLAALFQSLGSNIPGDLSLPKERLYEDLVDDPEVLKYTPDGQITIPTGPGWGFGKIKIFGY